MRDLILETIQRFVRNQLVSPDFDGVDPLSEVTLDSLALESLLAHLEDVYELIISGEDGSRANLSSVSAAGDMVVRCLKRVESGTSEW
jgi:acyl carrier protein